MQRVVLLNKFMRTKKEREAHFRLELEILLNRHQAEITAEADTKGFQVMPPHLEVTLDAIYDNESGDVLAEYADFRIQ